MKRSLFLRLIGHQWKESVRNPMFQKKLLVNILMGFFFLYMLSSFLILAFSLKFILKDLFDKPIVEAYNGLLLYTVPAALFFRILAQRLPLMDLTPYLHLPIRKGKLLHYLFFRTFFNYFNIVPLVFILPFFFNAVLPEYSAFQSTAWLATLLSIVLINNLLAFVLKKGFIRTPIYVVTFGVLLAAVFTMDYYAWIDLMSLSDPLFSLSVHHPWTALIPLALFIGTYTGAHRWTRGFLSLDTGLAQKGESVKEGMDFGLKKRGNMGRSIAFELDLIRRNKKARSHIILALIFLFYGLIFYPNPAYEGSYLMMLFVGILTTGIFMMNFGQLHFAWDSPHFDKLMTSPLRVREYIRAKYYLMIGSVVIMFLLSLPYIYFGIEVLWVNLASALFNVGVGSIVLLLFAMFNRRGMSLSKSNVFNFEGVQMSQFLMVPIALGFPLLLYGGFAIFGRPMTGIFSIGGVGLFGLMLHPILLPRLERMFHKYKHSIAEGFRSS